MIDGDPNESNKGATHIGKIAGFTMDRFKKDDLLKKDSEDKFIVNTHVAQRMYATVYHGLAIKLNLSPIESLVLATILSLSHKEGYAFASQKLYALLLNVTPTTINNALKKLAKQGVTEKIPNKSALGTTCWKLSSQTNEYVEYLQKQIKRDKREKHGERV